MRRSCSLALEPILHPTMLRATQDAKHLMFETATKLKQAGIPFALQGGFEPCVPKTRVALLEAAIAAAHELGFHDALAAIKIESAGLLGVAKRVGSPAPGPGSGLVRQASGPRFSLALSSFSVRLRRRRFFSSAYLSRVTRARWRRASANRPELSSIRARWI